ncbi:MULTISPECIES: TlyA family RNA methyltransferase [Brachymonas]|uniref:TlyA family RNA methyltransferase n=1 Tax=Brachymonas TaxID=28219 RepID=UPI002E794F7B|nr:TlyA family RNA methyltransferase [Brachymonas sp. J145]MEE1652799.1 TlyA family RNA methyltransferase [Brachymonas sp. J145]
MRADQLLVERGHAASRSQAQRLIAAGVQWRLPGAAWQAVRKNGEELPDYAELQLQDAAEARYVSRGGLKLEGALQAVGLDVTGLRCLDVGQSTGGFTDCLLQHGAASVIGIDVGQAQLHPRLRADARVTAHEKLNARDAAAVAAALGEHDGFDLLVGDLSFISQTLVWPAVLPQLKPGGQLLMLVKPQFELQPAQIGKGGIVRDARLYAEVEQRMRDCCSALNVELLHWLDSPIAGGDGNREFFVHGRKA